jgi:hypothetical protein
VTESITAQDVINSTDLRAFVSTNMNGASSVLIGLRHKHHSTEIGSSSNLMSLLTKGCVVNTASPSCRQASDPSVGDTGISSYQWALWAPPRILV